MCNNGFCGGNMCWIIILLILFCGCGNNGLCGCFGGGNWWWIIILLLIFCNCGGCGGNNWNGCDNNNSCGCC